MKNQWRSLLIIVLALVVGMAAADDCESVCAERHAAVTAERDTAVRERGDYVRANEQLIRERDGFFHDMERLTAEAGAARDERDAQVRVRDELQAKVNGSGEETANLLKEIEDLRKSLEKHREDMVHTTKVAQDNQKYMTEYKNELHTQRDKANKLDEAYKEATAKIEELESMTFLKQLQKEITGAWKAIVDYWTNLTNKDKATEL